MKYLGIFFFLIAPFASAQNVLKDLVPGSGDSRPDGFIRFNNQIYFSASTPETGRELWKTDGTADGTKLVKDINPGAEGGSPGNMVAVNNKLFFMADDGIHAYELWCTDGSSTQQLTDIGLLYTYVSNMVAFNDSLFFVAGYPDKNTGYATTGIWKTDGSIQGTTIIDDFRFTNMRASNDHLLTEGGSGVWSRDKKGKMTLLKSGLHLAYFESVISVNGITYFEADTPSHGSELWRTDGTPEGTYELKDIFEGQYSSSPKNLCSLGSKVIFTAYNSDHGKELWTTDGTPEGTVLLKDIYAGAAQSLPGNFTIGGTKLFFTAKITESDIKIFQTDGTSSGTIIIYDVDDEHNRYVTSMVYTNEALYVTTNDQQGFLKIDTHCGGYAVAEYPQRSFIPPTIAFNNSIVGQIYYYESGMEPYLYNTDDDPDTSIPVPQILIQPQGESSSLISTSEKYNQWLKDGVPVEYATQKEFQPYEPGSYQVKVTMGNCSQISQAVEWPSNINASEIDIAAHLLLIYPNPSAADVVVINPYAGKSTLILIDSKGIILQRVTSAERKIAVSARQLPHGLYNVVISSGDKQSSGRFVKE